MKTLLIALSVLTLSVACTKKSPETKLEEQRMEANKEYREDMRDVKEDANEAMDERNSELNQQRMEANKEFRGEMKDVNEDARDVINERNEELNDAREEYIEEKEEARD